MTRGVVSIRGRNVLLRPLLPQDLDTIFAWRSNTEDLHLWHQQAEVQSYEQFAESFRHFVRGFVHVLMMIQCRPEGAPIGMVYSYRADSLNGHAYLCVYLDPDHRRSVYGATASILFTDYLFCYYPFRKLYTEVYEQNVASLSGLTNAGLKEEGRLVDHRWHLDRYRDMVILAAYREQFYARFGRLLASLKR